MGRHAVKRASIERGVVEVVARKGLRGTTIQDIAEASDVSPGLLYRYWKNRDDLAADVYRTHYLHVLERLNAAAAGADGAEGVDGWGRLARMVRAFLRYADAEPTIVRFLLFSQHDLIDRVDTEHSALELVRHMLREAGLRTGGAGRGGKRKRGASAAEAGVVVRRIDPDLAAQLVLGIVLQPVVGVLYGDLPGPVSRYGEELLGALGRVLIE